jgi:hypothetical protein
MCRSRIGNRVGAEEAEAEEQEEQQPRKWRRIK